MGLQLQELFYGQVTVATAANPFARVDAPAANWIDRACCELVHDGPINRCTIYLWKKNVCCSDATSCELSPGQFVGYNVTQSAGVSTRFEEKVR